MGDILFLWNAKHMFVNGWNSSDKPQMTAHENQMPSWCKLFICHSRLQHWTLLHIFKWFTELHHYNLFTWRYMGGSRRGDRGSRPHPPWKITKILGFLAILVQIPWKITKLPSQYSMLSHHQHASETPFNGVSLVGRWWPNFSGILDPSYLHQLKKNVVRIGHPLTKLSGSAHEVGNKMVS